MARRRAGGSFASPIKRLGQRLTTSIFQVVASGFSDAPDLHAPGCGPDHAEVLAIEPHAGEVLHLSQVEIQPGAFVARGFGGQIETAAGTVAEPGIIADPLLGPASNLRADQIPPSPARPTEGQTTLPTGRRVPSPPLPARNSATGFGRGGGCRRAGTRRRSFASVRIRAAPR